MTKQSKTKQGPTSDPNESIAQVVERQLRLRHGDLNDMQDKLTTLANGVNRVANEDKGVYDPDQLRVLLVAVARAQDMIQQTAYGFRVLRKGLTADLQRIRSEEKGGE